MSRFASVLNPRRWEPRPSQLQPISSRRFARSMLPKRVQPIGRPVARSTVTNGIASPVSRSWSAVSM